MKKFPIRIDLHNNITITKTRSDILALVQPIRDKKILDKFKKEVLKRNKRDYIIVLIGINTGLRIGDIVPLKSKDLYKKTHISIQEQKTGKSKRFPIMHIVDEINYYIEENNLSEDDYLFESRQVDQDGIKRNISTTQAYRRLKAVAEYLNIEDFGTHSLRKSFGYHYYKQNKDIAKLMTIFNHSSEAITMRYIGITQEAIDDSMTNFRL